MDRKTVSIVLGIVGILTLIFPRWNGIFSQSNTSADIGRIIATILIVGALILWFSGKEK